ncbi:MAG: histidine phosphatase family protein [Clostridiales bacterium]|nr:histidine phosphatase family protein [Clostridiales bacterium]
MKLLIIRHGDPDYKKDSLTEKGWREAECLAEMLCKQDITYFYMSPYGRARDTASVTLRKMGRTAEVLTWLREFDYTINRPDNLVTKKIPWDWLPQDWTADERFYLKDQWAENERMAEGNVGEAYREVTEQFDALMEKHGYRREGGFWRAERPNHDTIALFCHFGLESVLLSHIFGVSPMPIWHHTCAAPTSVTTLVTEERRKGIALLRMLSYGDTSHLYAMGETPAFAARFCECYDDETRHD